MNPILFLPDDSTYLASHWLDRYSGDAPVKLLFSGSMRNVAQQIRDRYSVVGELIEIPSSDSSTVEETPCSALRVIVPIQPKQFLLRYFKPHMLPDLVPHYPLFRKLRMAGYTEFELYHLGGSKQFSISHVLDEYADLHSGKRCFVVGNGPSLNDIDMSLLKDEITLGANRCYLGFEKWGFPFTYWGLADWLQIEEYWKEYENNLPRETIKFFPFDYTPFLGFENGCPVNITFRNMEVPRFSGSCDQLHLGSTVTYLLIQIAVVMGCDPIVLIGVDHRYPFKKGVGGPGPVVSRLRGRVRRWLERRVEGTTIHELARAYARVKAENRLSQVPAGPDSSVFWEGGDAEHPTHFDSRYVTGETKRFRVPVQEWADRQFDLAARWAEENGIRILNATPNSALESFPKVCYEDLF